MDYVKVEKRVRLVSNFVFIVNEKGSYSLRCVRFIVQRLNTFIRHRLNKRHKVTR